MANRHIESRPEGAMLPWLVALAILIVLVGWLLYRNNQSPAPQGSDRPAMRAVARAGE